MIFCDLADEKVLDDTKVSVKQQLSLRYILERHNRI